MTRDTYSVGYDFASAEFFAQRRTATHAQFFLQHLQPGMSLLDIGCGPGTITLGLAALVAPGTVVGIDIEPSQIELAQARATANSIDNVRFQAADIYSLPFDDDSFAAVFVHGVLEHLSDPVRALREVRRVMQPGGVLGARHADFGGFLKVGGMKSGPDFIVFHGEKGRLKMRRNYFETDPPGLVTGGPDAAIASKWSGGGHVARPHLENWLDAIRSGATLNAPIEVGHRTVTICHLANIARELNQPLTWNPQRESFVDNAQAQAKLDRPRRTGFELPELHS